MSKQSPKQPTAAPSGAESQDPQAARARKEHHDEDTLHVPKGVSRGTFIFLIALIIFLMVIWLVPNAMFGITSGPTNPVAVRFTLPSGKQVEWKGSDLVTTHRALLDAFAVDFFLPFQLGIDGSKPEPDELTRLMILDRIARESGIEVSDVDLAGHLDQTLSFQRATREDFRNAVRARGLDQVTLESTIRMCLRVSRLQQLLGYIGAVPSPEKIEEQWQRENVEFAFDYVTLPVADLQDAARQELPDDAGLEAWFAELPEAEKAEFRSEEKRTAEVAFFRDLETTPASELIEAFPEVVPEGTEPTAPEELANQYYNRVQWRRFAKPAGDGDDVPAGFFGFDEVKESCLAEAPVFFALQRWIEDLNARHTNGEAIDFAAEAQRYGLDFQTFIEPLSRTDLASDAGANDREIANAVFSAPPDGSVFASPVALSQGIAVARANSRSEPELPAFAQIRDRVVEKWIEPRAQELAQERLAALRESLESFEPAPEEGETPPAPKKKAKPLHYRASSEAFRSAASALGLEVKLRDYLNKAGPPSKDPLAEDEERRTLSTQASAFGLYDLEGDEVAAAGLSADERTVYLVRLAGKRDVPIDQMSPTQYDRYKSNARQQAVGEMGKQIDLDFLRENFGLWLYQEDAEGRGAKDPAPKG